MPTIELCVPGGWLQNLSLNLGEICASSSSLAMSCVAFGVGVPKVHWSKKMRPTPDVAASRARSSCMDMSACSDLPSIANGELAPRDTGDSNTKFPLRMCAALATRTQFVTIAFARMTVAGNPPSLSLWDAHGVFACSEDLRCAGFEACRRPR
eukprot:732275-Pleurochrysis_carterae.AAC.1